MMPDTHPPMSVEDVMNTFDGVYLFIKNKDSVFLWCNQNFADLVGQTKEQIIGSRDERAEHVKFDQEVMKSSKPVLNLHESISVPDGKGGTKEMQIITQKGLLRQFGTREVIGITVCFSLQKDAQYWIKELRLKSIDLGGYFGKADKTNEAILRTALPERFVGDRTFFSTNYYLLQSPNVLKLHMLQQDEQWFFHTGNPVRLHIFEPEGKYHAVVVGSDTSLGQFLQSVVPHNTWFGAEILEGGYGLYGCSLAPGWDARDSFMPTPQQVTALKRRFPEKIEIITRLS
ncbi:MAG: cupin domain-containing protein [Nitrosomonas sp.]|nr:MAG: cupin domain-containing protein [Nitrosomonas sp.]